jgi:hypothetical protein
MLLRRIGSGMFRIEGRFPFGGSFTGMLWSLLRRHHRLLLCNVIILLRRRANITHWIAMLLGFGRPLEPTERAFIPVVRAGAG